MPGRGGREQTAQSPRHAGPWNVGLFAENAASRSILDGVSGRFAIAAGMIAAVALEGKGEVAGRACSGIGLMSCS